MPTKNILGDSNSYAVLTELNRTDVRDPITGLPKKTCKARYLSEKTGIPVHSLGGVVLRNLEGLGLISSIQVGTHKIYSLTEKGLDRLSAMKGNVATTDSRSRIEIKADEYRSNRHLVDKTIETRLTRMEGRFLTPLEMLKMAEDNFDSRTAERLLSSVEIAFSGSNFDIPYALDCVLTNEERSSFRGLSTTGATRSRKAEIRQSNGRKLLKPMSFEYWIPGFLPKKTQSTMNGSTDLRAKNEIEDDIMGTNIQT